MSDFYSLTLEEIRALVVKCEVKPLCLHCYGTWWFYSLGGGNLLSSPCTGSRADSNPRGSCVHWTGTSPYKDALNRLKVKKL